MSSIKLPLVTVLTPRLAGQYHLRLLRFRSSGFLFSTMPSQHRQKTDVLNYARVALLCMATTMVVGFTKPGDNRPPVIAGGLPVLTGLKSSAQHSTQQKQASQLLVKAPSVSVARASVTDITPPPVIIEPATRPYSYATEASIKPVLNQISGRYWLDASQYSLDWDGTELEGQLSGHFRGVGFPDIRTFQKKQGRVGKSLSGARGWSRMISWREAANTPKQEPIAHVRCMGLSPQAVANRADRYDRLIVSMAVKYDVSASLIKAVITEESCFNNKALSPVGAQGLMQLMPETASWLKVKDPHDPKQNLRAGVRYLASLQKQFDTLELVLAAYNAGPGNVRRYKGVPPFAETQAYVQKVQAHYRRYVAATRLASR